MTVHRIAAAIGEPARERMLYCLMDGHARTSTELAVVADVSPSTASVHLSRLKAAGLVKVSVQGKHHYYSLDGNEVAQTLEALSVLAGSPQRKFVPNTPRRLCAARTCYDHLAGRAGVELLDGLLRRGLLRERSSGRTDRGDTSSLRFEVTGAGAKVLSSFGLNIGEIRRSRRHFAGTCIDWTQRRGHLNGALAAAITARLFELGWIERCWSGPGQRRRGVRVTFGLDLT